MKNTSKIIRRADVTKNFTIIPNHIAQSNVLSPNAKSLIVHLLSMPNDWVYNKTQFWRMTNLGRNSFNKAWKELEQHGYIQSERIKDGNLVRGFNYIISDLPIFGLTENSTNQTVVFPTYGKLSKTKNTKNLYTKKDLTKTLDTNSRSTIGVNTEKSFLETFYETNKRFPTDSELINYINQ